ncbi:MAG: HAMP domain-containing protein, partial [Dehalococcoidia bacterium]
MSIINFFDRLGLQAKILLLVVVGLLSLFSLFGYLGLQSVNQATDLVFQERLRLTRAVANSVDDALNHYAKDTVEVAEKVLIDLDVNDPESVGEAFKELYSHLTDQDNFAFVSISMVGLLDSSNTLRWVEPPSPQLLGRSLGDTQQFQRAARSGKFIIFEADPLTTAGPPIARILVPVRNRAGQVGGMVVVDVDADVGGRTYTPLTGEDTETGAAGMGSLNMLQESGYGAEIINNRGMILAAVEEGLTPGDTSPHLGPIASLMKNRQSAVIRHRASEGMPYGDHMVAYAPVKSLPWGVLLVLLERDEDVALMLTRSLRQKLVLFGSIALAVILALAWATTRSVVRPVRLLTLASRKIADGDLEQPVALSGGDEVGQLARAFDDMRVRLRTYQGEIEEWSQVLEERVAQRTKELAALFEASQALTSTLQLDKLFEVLMAETREIFPATDAGALFLYNPDTQRLEAEPFFGFQADLSQRVKLQPGEDSIGQVFTSGKPMLSRRVTMSQPLWEGLNPENRASGRRP